jgi:hypothetical protein
VGRRRQAGHRHSRASPGMTLASGKTCVLARRSPERGTHVLRAGASRPSPDGTEPSFLIPKPPTPSSNWHRPVPNGVWRGDSGPHLVSLAHDAAGREWCRRALRHGLDAGPGIQVCRAGFRSARRGDAARGRRECVVAIEARDPMPEFTLVAFGTERNQRSAPVRPPCPAFDDRPPLVSLQATLGAPHHKVGALTAGRKARHSHTYAS